MRATGGIVAASVPEELRQAVASARSRDAVAALGAWAADVAEGVLPIWLAAFPGDRAPAAAIMAARLCSAGELPATRALEAAKACQEIAGLHLVSAGLMQPYSAAMAASGAARACAAVEGVADVTWPPADPARLFYEAVLSAVSARMPEDFPGAVTAEVGRLRRASALALSTAASSP